jgi:Tfp pilus assembly protein FimT
MIRRSRSRSAGGFSMLELVLVVAVMMIVFAIAVPAIQRQVQLYSLRSAVAATTGAIQSTRYQAIYHGCQYQMVLTAANKTFTVANQNPAPGTATCQAAFGAASGANPLPGSGVTMSTNLTLVFHPSGRVVATAGPANPIQFTMTYPGVQTETITVSSYGNIDVNP